MRNRFPIQAAMAALIIALTLTITSVEAGTDATNVTFVRLYLSRWTNGVLTNLSVAVQFDFPSAPGTNPRLQSAPDFEGDTWRHILAGELFGSKVITTGFPWTATFYLNPEAIGTDDRYFRVLYTPQGQ
ncbi:MAG TPA: hypothetical protein P5328_02355 [Candidatus Paceibacterota bacterium]|nr:hypothetical protein [Candidatus Paceibacterota bacterium]HRZ34405.1 hypothetical protein [Candidatus Paceibacterota bacterium]